MSGGIKFRAYIKSEKSYREIQTIAYGYDGQLEGVWTYRKIWEDKVYFGIDEVILEQYTGLKDKNGVEIYEGDIVIMYGSVYVIKWNEVAFSYIAKGQKEYYWLSLEKSPQIKVIGSIHENPELLKGEK